MVTFTFFKDTDKTIMALTLILMLTVVSYLDYITDLSVPLTYFYLIVIGVSSFTLPSLCSQLSLMISLLSRYYTFHQAIDIYGPLKILIGYTSEVLIFISFYIVLNKTKSLIQNLESLAMKDFLTDAYSSRYFYSVTETAIKTCQRNKSFISIIFIDIDNFKQVNDTYGHAAGDKLLKSIVNNLQCRLRRDDMIARLGGDEFGILLKNVDQDKLESIFPELYQQLLADIQRRYPDVTMSCGSVSYSGQKSMTVDILIHEADKLMYEVKSTTKNGMKSITM